jgi:hypothetical protein
VSLPKTFRDAIQICRKLGIYRLWIDALCIIQDDLKDWEIESAKMASIYAGASLTIAASNGETSESGCFHKPRNTPFLIKVNGDSTNLSVRMHERHDNFIQDVFLSSAGAEPLFTRGWALQERLLSRRILHYTKSEVVWECTTCMDCQCGGVGSTSYEHLKCEFGSIDSAKVDGVENLRTLWLKLVQNYTHRKLTKSRDKYPALSGLARRFAEKGAGTYLAGHWTSDLAQSLLWRPLMGYSRLEATPSWSWASFSGPVRFVVLLQSDEASAQNCLVDILDIKSELNMQNPYGAPLKAEIVVRARAVEGIYGTYDHGTRVFNRHNGLDLYIRPDDDSDLDRLQQFWGETYFTNSSSFKPSTDLVYDAYGIAHQSRKGLHLKNLKLFFPTVFCLLWSQPANLEKEDSRVYVLVVGQRYGDRKGAYRRLAICDMRASQHMPLRASDGEASADLFFEHAKLREFTLI